MASKSISKAQNRNRPCSRKALCDLNKKWSESDFVFFYGHGESAGDAAVFSNWYTPENAFVDADGNKFSTNEHYMMWRKAVLFGDTEMAELILAADTAKKAKGYGRKVRNFDEKTWSENSVGIVADGCELKFSQCKYAKSVLLGTNDKILVEAAPRDRIWGIGMGKGNSNRLDPNQWRGKNLLGEALMIARDRLKKKEEVK